MNWKSKYVARHLIQKCLGVLPRSFLPRPWAESRTERRERFVSEALLRSSALQKADQFERAALVVPRRVVEQGTGCHGLNLVFLHLAGAQRIETYDTRRRLQADLLHGCFQLAGPIAEALEAWSAVDHDVARARASALASVAPGTLEELLGHIDTSYHVKADFDRAELEEGSCDLFLTDSILQSLPTAKLERLITESRRFLGADGRQHHVIDCKDRESMSDRSVPELYYLSFSEATWRIMTSARMNAQNRLRKSDFVDLFRRAGCKVALEGVQRSDETVRWLRDRAHQLHLGRVEPLEEVAITHFELTTDRPAARNLPESTVEARVLAG